MTIKFNSWEFFFFSIEVGGVGYEVHMPMTCFYELPEAGQEAIVFTHFVVREDAQLLYGFNNKQERTLFKELIKTNGVDQQVMAWQ